MYYLTRISIMKKLMALIFTSLLFLGACNDDDDTPAVSLNSSFNGLANLGADFQYEGWIIVNGAPVTTGTFAVDDNSNITASNTVNLSADDISNATAFVLSIEPIPDSDPAPSAVKLLGGDFSGNSANLSVAHSAALADDFTSAAGKYLITAPTSTDPAAEFSGVWFIDNSTGSAAAGLNLPALPTAWKYEGWAVTGGTPLSTGTFSTTNAADDSSPFSDGGPAFPGEDFITGAPTGINFPLDLRGETIVVSIEPNPDNSPDPFLLKPLVSSVPATLPTGPIDMTNQVSTNFPTGTVSR